MPRSIFLVPGVGAQGGRPGRSGGLCPGSRGRARLRPRAQLPETPDPAAAAAQPARCPLGHFEPLTEQAVIRSAVPYDPALTKRSNARRPGQMHQPDALDRTIRPGGADSSSSSWRSSSSTAGVRLHQRPARAAGATSQTGGRAAAKTLLHEADHLRGQNGDTLTSIAHKHRALVVRIQALNPRSIPQTLISGRSPQTALEQLGVAAIQGAGALAMARLGVCSAPGSAARRSRRASAQLAAMALCRRGRPVRTGARRAAWALIDARTGEVLTSHAGLAAPPDRQHDQADDRLGGSARAAAGEDRAGALPTTPTRRIAARASSRGSGSASATCSTGMVLVSGNDAAYDLALAAAGSERTLRAPDEPQGGGARPHRHPLRQPDRARSARQLLQRSRPAYPGAATCWRFRSLPGSPTRAARCCAACGRRDESSIINELLRMAPWVNGVKTGHTSDAGYVRSARAGARGSS